MRRVTVFALAFGLILGTLASPAAAGNVALGKPVDANPLPFGVPGPTYIGAGWEIPAPPIAAFSTLTDGVFLDESHQWNMGTVWWDSSSYAPNLDIDLQADYLISRIVVQADNNDEYLINLSDDLVVKPEGAIVIPAVAGWGMMTRDIVLPTPVLADRIRFGHHPSGAGDDLYSVSEIQAFGTPAVPAPAAIMLLGSGLLTLIGCRHRVRITPRSKIHA